MEPHAHTIEVFCSAAYRDGSTLFECRKLIADTIPRPIHKDSGYQMIDIRLAVPRHEAEALLNGLRSGKVDLCIDSMASELEEAA